MPVEGGGSSGCRRLSPSCGCLSLHLNRDSSPHSSNRACRFPHARLPDEIMPAPTGNCASMLAGVPSPGRARSSRIAPRAWSPSTGPRIPPQSLGVSPKSEADRLSVAFEAGSPASRVSLDQGPFPSIWFWPLTAGAGVSDWLNGLPLSTHRGCGDRRQTETVAPGADLICAAQPRPAPQ